MKQFAHSIRFALTALALVGFAGPGTAQAQQPPTDLVPFKATVSGKFDGFLIPSDPPVLAVRMTLKGTSELQSGEVTYVDTHTVHLGIDGAVLRATNGIGVLTWPSGDALFVHWDGVADPSAPMGTVQAISGFTIKGGRGKFAGAAGSGMMRGVIDVAKGEETQVFQGLVTRPKP